MKKRYFIVILFILTAPAALYSREFLNTVVHLNFGGMSTFSTSGDLKDAEKNAIDLNIPENTNISHYEVAYCATLDIVPTNPMILGMEEHALKFGVRGSYRIHLLQQSLKVLDVTTSQVMNYNSWMLGPVIHYAPFIEPSDLNEDYTANGGFTLYALYGRIYGDLTGFPSLRENNIPVGDYETGVSGSKYDIGIGAEIAICSLNIGVNLYYTHINLNMKKAIYAGVGRKSSLNEGCIELYVGIPIESFIDPLIPKF